MIKNNKVNNKDSKAKYWLNSNSNKYFNKTFSKLVKLLILILKQFTYLIYWF